jgi:capsular exopolysaccharide synthesis family protein
MINFSELLWKASPTKDRRFRSARVPTTDDFEPVSSLRNIPVEKAELETGCRLQLLTDPRSASADRFRYLRMRLRELRELAKLRSLVITSPLPDDGKSTIAMALATALAEGGKHPTLLIEADLHHPTLARTLGLEARPGLAECLEDGLDPLSLIRKVEPIGFYLLEAGTPRGNPTELLQSDALPTVMQGVLPNFDWILIDTPPALALTDAVSLSRQVDATLLVARADRTSSEAIEQTLKLIGQKHVVGVVLNCADGLHQLYSDYYGYYAKQ